MAPTNHLYSKPYLPPTSSSPQCRTSLPIRISNHEDIANRASLDFLKAWEAHGLPVPGPDYLFRLCSCELGHLIALALPEARPDRIAVLTKVVDLILAADDLIDGPDASQALATAESLSCLDAVDISVNSGKNGLEAILSSIFQEAVHQDPVLGRAFMQTMLKYWALLKRETETERMISPTTFLDFLPIRFGNFASPITIDMASYALSISLTLAEKTSLQRLAVAVSTTQILWNDLISWPKEQAEYSAALELEAETGTGTAAPTPPLNTIPVLMREHGISESQAMRTCRRKILQYERLCGLLADGILRGGDESVSDGVKRVAETYRLSVSGWAVWSWGSWRYRYFEGEEEREGWREEEEVMEGKLDAMFWAEW